MKRITHTEFDEDLADLIRSGRAKAILNGVNVRLVATNQVKSHHHVLSTDEALKRLQLKPERKSFWHRLVEWIRD